MIYQIVRFENESLFYFSPWNYNLNTKLNFDLFSVNHISEELNSTCETSNSWQNQSTTVWILLLWFQHHLNSLITIDINKINYIIFVDFKFTAFAIISWWHHQQFNSLWWRANDQSQIIFLRDKSECICKLNFQL